MTSPQFPWRERVSIKPDDQSHRDLDRRVTEYLVSRGYLVADAPYHAVMPRSIVEAIQKNYSPTALYLRGRADRVAVHESQPLAFEWEVKTHHVSSRLHDMTIEALPLAHHLARVAFGVDCLYVYHDPVISVEAGFWVHDLPNIREILIPDRWDAPQRYWFHKIFDHWFDAPVRGFHATRGSGDPFVVVDESVVRDLPHWTTQIDNYC